MGKEKNKDVLIRDFPADLHKKIKHYKIDNNGISVSDCMIKLMKKGLKDDKKSKSS